MVWSIDNSKNDESSKVRWELVPYFNGKCLDIGAGAYKVFPHFSSVDNGHHWGQQWTDIRVNDAKDLSQLGSASWDLAYSSHLLEHFHYEDVPQVLREWMRVTKLGGHLILYVPDEAQYPKCGTEYANGDHKWDCSFDKVIAAMEKVECGWDLIDYQVRSEEDEYSLFFVFKKEQGRQHKQSWKNPKPKKTAAVVRYGAQGDNIQTSSLLPWLKEQGFHVTFYCQDGLGYEVIKHDPHIDRFIVQGKDQVPPQFLEEFFAYTKKKFDKWINLCESVEGTLLASPKRPSFEWPNEARAIHMDRNYLEWMHLLAGVPGPYRPKFYSTLEERSWAQKQKSNFGRRNVLWSLAGSSGHKVWPHLDTIIARLMLAYEDVDVVLVGDESCKLLEQGWGKLNDKDELEEVEPRVHLRSGKWTIRQSMSFADAADLIIGTETGLLNAAGSMDTPKIITLSHSSPEMLVKHWRNVIALQQPKGVGCAKSPCRQLHGADNTSPWLDCPQHEETGTALCQYHVTPEAMWSAVVKILGKPTKSFDVAPIKIIKTGAPWQQALAGTIA
jgi:ADP-heptose:LPS heptosyltransferase/predicted SAM-dependent methyltransferase